MRATGRMSKDERMGIPQDPASRFDRKATPLTRIVDQVPEQAWSNPSPCEGWSAADVLEHLIDTERTFILTHGGDMPELPPKVSDGPALAWRTHAEAVARALIDPRVGEKPQDTPFGTSTVGEVFDDFYGFDLIVHRWDIARAAGMDARLTEAELETIDAAAEGWGDQLYGDGICKEPIDVPADTSREVRVLARFGRDAR